MGNFQLRFFEEQRRLREQQKREGGKQAKAVAHLGPEEVGSSDDIPDPDVEI